MENKKPYKSKRLSIAKPDIIKYFDNYNKKCFKLADLGIIFSSNREFWRAAKNTSKANFISFLLSETKLKQYSFDLPNRKETRYAWGDISFYQLIFSLNPKGYFSHYTAMSLHGLTEQIPKIYYFNVELKPINIRNKGLSQQSIDIAFKNKPRVSNNIAEYEDKKICMINGKFSNSLGITEITDFNNEIVRVSDIERTLIDITVRPVYSGGVYEVLKAFKMAKNMVSINKLVAYLKKLDYTYPYHQAIGFYIEKAGIYDVSQINLLKKFKFEYDFYLAHKMTDMSYSKEWKLFYPSNF